MPNRAAKARKMKKRKINIDLRVNGRTANQRARNKARAERRQQIIKGRKASW